MALEYCMKRSWSGARNDSAASFTNLSEVVEALWRSLENAVRWHLHGYRIVIDFGWCKGPEMPRNRGGIRAGDANPPEGVWNNA